MKIEFNKTYSGYQDRFKLECDIEFDENEMDEIKSVVLGNYSDLANGLRRIYRSQAELYKTINEEKFYTSDDEHKYAPESRNFTHHDEGFSNFVRDMNERELRVLSESYANIISEKVEYIRQMYLKQKTERIELIMEPGLGVPTDLEKINIAGPSLVIANDKVYQLELREADGFDSLQDITDKNYNILYNDMNSQNQAIRRVSERRVDRMKEMFEKEKNDLFTEIVKNSKAIFQNWEFVDFENQLYLKHKDKIVVDKVIKDGRMYRYPGPPDFRELYVTGLKIRVTSSVTDTDVRVTRGFNVHFNGSVGCIGELQGKGLFEALRDTPHTLTIANMDSPLNDRVASYLRENFLDDIEHRERIESW